jgi:hypothetical protein
LRSVTIDAYQAVSRTVYGIGSVGENEAVQLVFNVASDYASDGNFYLDFQLPNGLVTQTPALSGLTYEIPNEFLTRPGRGKCNLLYKTGDTKEVVCKFELEVSNAINADDTLVRTYKNVIEDLEKRTESWESAAASAEAAAASAALAESYTSHPPIINAETGNWEEWDGTEYVETSYASKTYICVADEVLSFLATEAEIDGETLTISV